MLKVNILKELKEERQDSINQVQKMEEVIGEVKLLLEGNELAEREILKEAGLDSQLVKFENKKGLDLERKKFEERYETVYTETEIKSICQKYHLKFLKSNYFKGNIDPVLGAKILNFFKARNIDSHNYEASKNLYIMAPYEAFNLEDLPEPKKIDPVIFYKLAEDKYAMIHKWGNDFSIYRLLRGMVMYNRKTSNIFEMVIRFFIFLSCFAAFSMSPFHWISLLFSVGLAIASQLMWDNIQYDSEYLRDKLALRYSEIGWNSSHK